MTRWRDPIVLGPLIAAIITSIVAPILLSVIPTGTKTDADGPKPMNDTGQFGNVTGGDTGQFGNVTGAKVKSGRNETLCNSSYPDICITADVDCSDIQERNFKVIGRDPYNLDPSGNGIGCEE